MLTQELGRTSTLALNSDLFPWLGKLSYCSTSKSGWTSLTPPRTELPVCTAWFLSIIMNGKTCMQDEQSLSGLQLFGGHSCFFPSVLARPHKFWKLSPVFSFPQAPNSPLGYTNSFPRKNNKKIWPSLFNNLFFQNKFSTKADIQHTYLAFPIFNAVLQTTVSHHLPL